MSPNGCRRVFLTLFLLVYLASTALALDFSADVKPSSQAIRINETARFTLTITNEGVSSEAFEIYSPDVQWDVATDPSTNRILEVPGGKSSTTALTVRPLYVNPGLYVVGLVVKRSGTSELVAKSLEIGITKDVPGEYAPSIRTALDFSDDLDPRSNASLRIELENQNRRDLGEIQIKVRSNLINQDLLTKLGPLEKKQLSLSYQIDQHTPPQNDNLRVTAFAQWKNKTVQFDSPPIPFSVISYGGVEEKVEQDQFLLANTKELRFTNTGNIPRTKTYKERMSLSQQWFMTVEPDPQVKQGEDGTYYIWKVDLAPGQEATVTIIENYRPVGYAILLIFVIIIGFFFVRTPVITRKAAMVVETKEGGISELKVLITIKNRSSSMLSSLEVVDRVPQIAEIKPDHEVGTLRPTQILRHESKGVQLKWELENLDPQEERILSYKIRTKLSVLGGLNLPPCRIGFKHFGYSRTVVSNMENLFGGH